MKVHDTEPADADEIWKLAETLEHYWEVFPANKDALVFYERIDAVNT
jgi:hypothetical protein